MMKTAKTGMVSYMKKGLLYLILSSEMAEMEKEKKKFTKPGLNSYLIIVSFQIQITCAEK